MPAASSKRSAARSLSPAPPSLHRRVPRPHQPPARQGRIRAGCAFPGAASSASPTAIRGDVLLSVRPEDIGLRTADGGPGSIIDVTFLGADVEHKVDIAGLTLRARASGLGAPVLPPGTRVAVDLPSQLHRLVEHQAPMTDRRTLVLVLPAARARCRLPRALLRPAARAGAPVELRHRHHRDGERLHAPPLHRALHQQLLSGRPLVLGLHLGRADRRQPAHRHTARGGAPGELSRQAALLDALQDAAGGALDRRRLHRHDPLRPRRRDLAHAPAARAEPAQARPRRLGRSASSSPWRGRRCPS